MNVTEVVGSRGWRIVYLLPPARLCSFVRYYTLDRGSCSKQWNFCCVSAKLVWLCGVRESPSQGCVAL